MPAYLSLSFQYSKKQITEQTVRSFCDALLHCGLTFAGGYWESEGDGYDEIIRWNQQKLEQNFELGYTEHYTHDYKQMLFDYMDFSEVRLFMMNMGKQSHFTFELIIPETDFFDAPDAICAAFLRLDRLEQIENLAVRLWECETMDCIQAGWELADDTASFTDIVAGEQPLAEPFCIVPKSVLRSEWNAKYRHVGREGICIRNVERFQVAE